jgi:hypothetical protein
MSSKSREWLLYNAVLTWIHHYPDVGNELLAQYQQLEKELQFEYEDVNEQPTPIETRKRGRPAKRQRTKKAASNPASTEESKATNQEA